MHIWFRILLYIHITSVIMSLGPFFVLIPLVRRLNTDEPNVRDAYLIPFKASVRLAKHAGHVLVGSGILLVIVGKFPWTTSWILLTLLVLISSLLFLARAFSPTIRRLGANPETKEQAVRKLTKSIWIYIVLLMFMLWMMVTKPVLW